MLDDILSVLREASTDGWAVTDEKKHGWEFYFIRHNLDQNRSVNTEHINVTVYKKSADGKYLGNATEEIPPDAGLQEIKVTVDALIRRAGLIRNPVYALRKPADLSGQAEKAADSTDRNAEDFIRTLASIDETPTEDINCYEIFSDYIEKRLVTSTGIDLTEQYPSSMAEVVVNARNAAHEIELYRMYTSGSCDSAALQQDITKTLSYAKDRLLTEPTPEVSDMPLLLSTADAVQVYQYFAERSGAGLIYRKVSDWKKGAPIAENVRGDRITLTARQSLPNSSRNFLFDEEGAPIRDEVLIEDGILKNIWGGQMFSGYLGIPDTFILSNFEVSGGTRTEEELRQGRYLEVVEFSDFQVDATTGDIFGEIRLGYLHDGGTVRIVTGGSVSGSMLQAASAMQMSSERRRFDNVLIPSVTVLSDGITFTAAKTAAADH